MLRNNRRNHFHFMWNLGHQVKNEGPSAKKRTVKSQCGQQSKRKILENPIQPLVKDSAERVP